MYGMSPMTSAFDVAARTALAWRTRDSSDGVSVVGRIDLVKRIDTGERLIVDLKSSDRAPPRS